MNHNIKFGDHYFFPLSPMQNYGFVSITGYGDEIYTECVVKQYHWDDNMKYKMVLSPIDKEHFTDRSFYVEDFEKHIEDGMAIKKENNTQHVELVRWAEPIDGTSVYIVCEGTCVVGEV